MRIGVIGNGKMVIDCIKHILNHASIKICFAIYDASIDNPNNPITSFFESNNLDHFDIPNLNSEDTIKLVTKYSPDFIFNINSYKIIKTELLYIPQYGIINFHNSLLPNYRGVNIPSWVIINGETEHGVTWHFMDQGVDTGPILANRAFNLSSDITARELMTKCILTGIQLFKEIFEDIINRKCTPNNQMGRCEHHYRYKDFPKNMGYIDFAWSYEEIDRFVRGLSYFPFENNFSYAKLRNSSGEVILNRISRIGNTSYNSEPGTIFKANKNEFQIACSDSIIELDDLLTSSLTPLTKLEAIDILKLKEGSLLKTII